MLYRSRITRTATTQHQPRIRRPELRRLTEGARDHWPLVAVVFVGGLMRLLTMVGYPPALLFPDSWGYISSAYSGIPNELPTVHPVGYPMLIRIFTLGSHNLAYLTGFQHLGGIAIGITVYALLRRAGLPRWAATAAAALTLLDGYGITLEQYVMSDTFFAVLSVAAVVVIAWPQIVRGPGASEGAADGRPSGGALTRRALLAGLLLAAATLVRENGPFVLPVLIVYLLWLRAGWRPLVALILAMAIPLLIYGAAVDREYNVFGMTTTSGWTWYGRVGGFANCEGLKLTATERKLCETPAQRASHPSEPDWYVWGPSPAQKLFHPDTQSHDQIAPTNQVLNKFAKTIIEHQPLDFVGATLRDFIHYFTPDVTAYQDAISATSLPKRASAEARSPAVQRADLPGLKPQVRGVGKLVRAYRSVVHVPRPVLALLTIAAALALLLRTRWRREIWLFTGSGVLMLLGTAATGGFGLRYLIPAVPLIAVGGGLAVADLIARLRGRATA